MGVVATPRRTDLPEIVCGGKIKAGTRTHVGTPTLPEM